MNVSITQPMDTMTSMGDGLRPFDDASSNVSVEAHVPEKINLSCHLENGGNVSVVEKKVEGDVNLSTNL